MTAIDLSYYIKILLSASFQCASIVMEISDD